METQTIITIIAGIWLLAMALLDYKHKKVPSIFSTTLILFLAVFSFYSTPQNPLSLASPLSFGLLGFIFGYLLWEFGWIGGIADLKAIIIISFFVGTINGFLWFMFLTALTGLIYSLGINTYSKVNKEEEYPFLPALFIVFLIIITFISPL